jgi:hypothetical protein
VVAGYLKQKGVNEDRLELRWQTSGAKMNDVSDLKLLRKVEITVIE